MSEFYNRQHTFVNGTTADGGEVEEEFVAVEVGMAALEAALAALGLGTLVPDPVLADAAKPVVVNAGGTGFTLKSLADFKTWLGLNALAYLNTVGASQIDAGAISLAKHADFTADTFLARSTGTGAPSLFACTAVGRAILAAADASAQRTALGLGTVAVESTVPVNKGGTGATDAAGARTALSVYSQAEITTALALLTASGTPVQSVVAENATANVAGSVVSGTYPALTGGTLLASVTITPTSGSDKIEFSAHVPIVASASRIRFYAYILESGGTNVLASATLRDGDTANGSWLNADMKIERQISAGGTSARTFELYFGYNDHAGFGSCVANSEGGESFLKATQVRA